MACLTKSNSDNFITFNKVNGGLTLAELQADGYIGFCGDVLTAPYLTSSSNKSYQIVLDWSNVGGQTGFTLQRKVGAGSYSTLATLNANQTTYTDTGLDAVTTYTYRIRANGLTDNSEYSNQLTIVTDQIEAPTFLNLTNIELESITLNWTSNSAGNEDGFKIERSLTGTGSWSQIDTVSTGVVTYEDDSSLDHNTTYYYRVRSYQGSENSSYSAVASATTLAMDAPTNLQLTPSYGSVTATWTSNSGGEEDGFDLEASANGVSGWSVVDSVASGFTTGEETGLSQGETRYYRVRATEDQGNSPYSDVVMTTTLVLQPPSDIVLTPSYGEVTVDWTSNSGGDEDGFDVERSLTGVGDWTLIDTTASGVVTYEDTGLTQTTDYYYRVKATLSNGDSTYAAVVMTTTLTLETPTSLIASLPDAPSQIQLDWTSNSGGNEDGFDIERSLTGVGDWASIGTTSTGIVTYTDINVLANTEYYYRVKATRTSGDSGYSNIVSEEIEWVAAAFGYYQFGQIDFGGEAPTYSTFELVDTDGDTLSDAGGDDLAIIRET
jgi:titin